MTPSRGQVSLRPAPDPDAPVGHHRFEVDVDGVVPHGHVVLVRRSGTGSPGSPGSHGVHDEVEVLDLRLDDLGLAVEVCALVEDVAVASGATRLALDVAPGDLVRAAFVVGGGFHPVRSRLRLDLDHPLPVEDRVVLRPLLASESELAAAWEQAPGHHLLVGHEPGAATEAAIGEGISEGAVVGTAWVSTTGATAAVHDLQVPPTRREHGLGSALLRAVAGWARERGAHEIRIELAAADHVARGLVDHVGFHLVEDHCVKDLGVSPATGSDRVWEADDVEPTSMPPTDAP